MILKKFLSERSIDNLGTNLFLGGLNIMFIPTITKVDFSPGSEKRAKRGLRYSITMMKVK